MQVLVLDDHPLIRRAIGEIVQECSPSVVLREASTGEEALHIVNSDPVAFAILDIGLPDQDGLKVLRTIKQLQPNTRCLILTIHDDPWYVSLAMKHGASGYLIKGSDVDELRQAIQTVMAGGRYVAKDVAESFDQGEQEPLATGERASLSAREMEVFMLLAKGLTVTQVSAQLKLSDRTVSTYRGRILNKLGLQTTADLIRYAIEQRLVQ